MFSNSSAGLLLAADQIGDRRGFEIGIDFGGDALELAQRLDLLQPGIEIARVGAADDLLGTRRLCRLSFVAGRADSDAHVHGSLPSCFYCERPKSSVLSRAMGTGDCAQAAHIPR